MQRILSAFVLVSFISMNHFVIPAYGGNPSPDPAVVSPFPDDLSKLEVPREIGKVWEFYKGIGNEVVVLIQDAHAIPDAQRNIQKLIDYFQKEYGIRLVALEGASSQLDPQIFRSFPDKELLQKVFQEYLAQGELAGGTAAAIFSAEGGSGFTSSARGGPAFGGGGNETIFHGIEDWNLYEGGLTLYLEAMKKEPEISKKLGGLRKDLEEKKIKVYSKELLEIDSLLENFYKNHSNLLPVLKKLAVIKEPAPGSELALLIQEIKRNPEGNQSIEIEEIGRAHV